MLTLEASAEELDINWAKKDLIDAYATKKDYKKALAYAKDLQKSKDRMFEYHGIYSEAYITKELGKSIPEMKQKAIELYNKAIAYYRNCMISRPADYTALIYRIKANVDIGNREQVKKSYSTVFKSYEELNGMI